MFKTRYSTAITKEGIAAGGVIIDLLPPHAQAYIHTHTYYIAQFGRINMEKTSRSPAKGWHTKIIKYFIFLLIFILKNIRLELTQWPYLAHKALGLTSNTTTTTRKKIQSERHKKIKKKMQKTDILKRFY